MNHCDQRSTRRRYRLNRRGASAVEFALIAPIMIVYLLGTIDAGQLVNVQHKVVNASREGARVAARSTTLSEHDVTDAVSEYIEHAFPGVEASELNAAITVLIRDVDDNVLTGSQIANTRVGDPISVKVNLEFETVRWLSDVGLLGQRTLSSTTVMRREPL